MLPSAQPARGVVRDQKMKGLGTVDVSGTLIGLPPWGVKRAAGGPQKLKMEIKKAGRRSPAFCQCETAVKT